MGMAASAEPINPVTERRNDPMSDVWATLPISTLPPKTAAAPKNEARRRAVTGTFFGHIAYASLIAHKPA